MGVWRERNDVNIEGLRITGLTIATQILLHFAFTLPWFFLRSGIGVELACCRCPSMIRVLEVPFPVHLPHPDLVVCKMKINFRINWLVSGYT